MAYDAQEDMEEEVAEHFRTPFLIGRIIKISLIVFVIAINLLVIWRVFFSASIPKDIKTVAPNQTLCEVYREYGAKMTVQYQDQYTINYDKGREGAFGVPTYIYIPEAKQIQVVFRYNNSTLRRLAEEYGMTELPDKDSEYFDVTLLQVTDLTPEDLTDKEEALNRIAPTSKTRDTTLLYTYYRYVFDGVEIDPNAVSSMFLDVYYLGDLHYDQKPYGSLLLYTYSAEWRDVGLTAKDKKVLQDFAG